MQHLTPVSVLGSTLRFLPLLCLSFVIACTGGDGAGGDDLTGEVLADVEHGDMVIDTPHLDGIPEIEPELPMDVPPVDTTEDLESELPGDVVPEIVPDVGPCGGACDDGDPCTLDECDPELGCVNTPIEGCCEGQFPLALGFEGEDPFAGGTVEPLVAPYPDAPDLEPLTWQVVEDKAWAGTGSLYFGNPAMGNYHNDHRVAAQFVTAPLTLEAGYAHTLSLQAWIDVEEGIWSDYFVLFVRTGGDDYPIWAKDDFNVSMGAWNPISVDLTPFAGEPISLVFLFDTHDEKENFGAGIYIDDISIERACEPLTCSGLADCFTLSPCLDGQCVDGQCAYTWDPDCCLTPAECEDWDGCTLEFCDDNVCYSQPDPDPACCNTNDECMDEDEICTEDVCKNNVCTYLPSGAEGCCQVDAECDDTDPCTKDLCTDQACVYINLCCAVDDDCDDGDDQCTADQCIGGSCYFVPTGAEGCCVEELVDETFEDESTPDFALDSTLTGVGFEVMQGDAYGGAKALILEAIEPTGSFTATATLSVTEIPPVGASLSFAVKLGMGDSGDCGQNEFRVLVGDDVVWSSCATLNNYLPVTLDLSSYAGDPGPVAFVYEVNPMGGTYWAGVDTVVFSQSCCSADEDCEDGNPCTADVCPGSNAVCQFPPIEGCCLSSTECDDGDVCSEDVCTGENVCEHYNLCCESDAECDDGDDECTDDLCINSFCQYIPTGASGCCTPLTWQEDFEAGLPGWEITGTTGDFGWQASQAKAVSGSFSLAYSNAAGTEYNPSAFATALTPPLDLPDQSGVSLVFQLWYELESCCDDFDLFIVTDGGEVSLGNWAGSGTSWQEVSIDVTEWAGETVQLKFQFDSDGSVQQDGVFIDDLSITQECCSDDAECDDGNPCTVDSCPGIDSLCAFVPIEGCCIADAECGDGDPCTQDSCTSDQGGECLNIWICCETDADCDDGEDVCTDDVCVDDFCQFLFTGAPGCCEPTLWEDAFENGQGGWVFENSSPSPSWHLSTVKSSDGGTALAFSDAAGLSTGTSQDSTATSPTVEVGVQPGVALTFQVWYDTETNFDWCKVWVDHPAGSAQLDQFTGHNEIFWQEKTYSLEEWAGQEINVRFEWHCDGSASYPGIWIDEIEITQGCCNADADCEDDNPCTVDDCPGLESMCNNSWIEGCCLNDAGCDDGDPCTDDFCTTEGGECYHVEICCVTDADCDDDDDVCTDDVCVDEYCQFLPTGASGCCTPVVYENDFESDLDGWTISNSSGAYGWKLSTAMSVSGGQSLAYTDAGGTSYGTGNSGSCLSPPLELPDQPGLALSFMLWYKIESCCDDFDLSVVTDAGTTLIANYASTSVTGWQEVSFDATAYQGQTVQLLMEFSCDGSVSYEGVFIDDLMVTQECCSADAECDDGDVCTMDSCPGIDSLCLFEPIPDCCSTEAECDDGDPCTEDSCPMTGEGCLHIDVCCQTDADCDDGDDVCTDDLCVDDFCEFIPTGAGGCCEPLTWADGFEAGAGDWTFTGGDATYKWHYSTAKATEGTTALHYGDVPGTSYGNSQDGDAISGLVTLTDQPDQTLSLWVWYDTETNLDYCRLFVVDGGVETQLDQYTGHDQGAWEQRTYDLGAYAGKEIQLKLEFHTDSSVTYPGVWIDGIEILQACCASDAECDDGNPCTEDSCPGAQSLCINAWADLCCLEDGDCDDGDACTEDVCTDMACTYEEICCETDAECDDGDDVCTDDSCVDGICVNEPTGAAGCCVPEIWTEGFEGALDGWTLDAPDGDYSWHASGVKAMTGALALSFGDLGGTSYGNSTDGDAVSPVVLLPSQAGLALHLAVWFDTEGGLDYCNLMLKDLGTGGEVQLDQFTGHDQGIWENRSYDLGAWKGKEVQFKFVWHSDSSVTYSGVWIDDMAVLQECCSVDGDCDDGNVCTADTCPGEDSLCQFTPIADCCAGDADCADEDPCTTDLCPVPGGSCTNTWICCDDDAGCDDGDDVCTGDACVNGFCVFTPTGAEGCCTPPLFQDDFSTDLGWTLEGEWAWGEAQASIDQQTGNPDPDEDHTGSADDLILGVVLGGSLDDTVAHPYYYATSPAVDASGIAASLKLTYWRVLNSDYSPYSNNSAEVWDGAAWQVLYETGTQSPDDEAWTYFEHDITAFANDALQVRFGYSVGDSGAVFAGSSWNLDDLRIQEDVAPFCCTFNSDCEGMEMTCFGAICQ